MSAEQSHKEEQIPCSSSPSKPGWKSVPPRPLTTMLLGRSVLRRLLNGGVIRRLQKPGRHRQPCRCLDAAAREELVRHAAGKSTREVQ